MPHHDQRPLALQALAPKDAILSMPATASAPLPPTAAEACLWLACAAVAFARPQDVKGSRIAQALLGPAAAPSGHDATASDSRGIPDTLRCHRAAKAAVTGLGCVGVNAARIEAWLQAAHLAQRGRAVWPFVASQSGLVCDETWRYLRVSAGIFDHAHASAQQEADAAAHDCASAIVKCIVSSVADAVDFASDLRFAGTVRAEGGGGVAMLDARPLVAIVLPTQPRRLAASRDDEQWTTSSSFRGTQAVKDVSMLPSSMVPVPLRFLTSLSVRHCSLMSLRGLLPLSGDAETTGQDDWPTPALTRLVVSNNLLASVPRALLCGHPSLTHLDASGNRIGPTLDCVSCSAAPPDNKHDDVAVRAPIPAQRSWLQHVDLGCNRLQGTFPSPDAGDGGSLIWPCLTHLDVSGNSEIDHVGQGFLDSLVGIADQLAFVGIGGCAVSDRPNVKACLGRCGLRMGSAANIDVAAQQLAEGRGSDAAATSSSTRTLRCFAGALSPAVLPHQSHVCAGAPASFDARRALRRAIYAVFASVALARRSLRLVAEGSLASKAAASAASGSGAGRRLRISDGVAVPWATMSAPWTPGVPSAHRHLKEALFSGPL